MIIKGGSRASGAALGVYLQNQERNERATVLDVRGTVSQDVIGALKEMEAYAEGTKCQLPLYHAQLNPEPPYRLTPEQLAQSLDRLETELGLSGQPRVVVAHENEGREHFHIVWARIDLEKMRAIPDSHNYKKHESVARDLEREFDHPRVQGAHAERENVERPERSPSRAELRQEERTGIKGKDVKEEVTALFRGSEDAEVFCNSLDEAGYILAKGDRRDFVIVDRAGGDHSLARRIQGMKAAELRKFMAPIDRNTLPTVEEAKGIAEDRFYGGSAFDQQCWEDALATAALDHVDANNRDRAQKADDRLQDLKDKVTEQKSIAWEDQLAAAAIKKAEEQDEELKRQRKEARDNAKIEAAYGRGEDYVTQANAARRDHENRTELKNKTPHAQHPDQRERTVPEAFEIAKDQLGDPAKKVRAPVEPPEPDREAVQYQQDLRDSAIGSSPEREKKELHKVELNEEDLRSITEDRVVVVYSDDAKPKHEVTIKPDELAAIRNEKPVGRPVEDGKKYLEVDLDEERRRAIEDDRASGNRIDDMPDYARRETFVEQQRDKKDESYKSMDQERYERMRRLLNTERGGEEVHERDDDPDRQREVPGGGRTRDR